METLRSITGETLRNRTEQGAELEEETILIGYTMIAKEERSNTSTPQ